ncbi:hypothetical protein ACFWDI_32410 [Streptomyces sp. NPDC060064]|uniref:hypothetical protein n=1 Tax=Streptomyces sp. NPDC060064 TaxID=3347049 RepID=UPI00367BE594
MSLIGGLAGRLVPAERPPPDSPNPPEPQEFAATTPWTFMCPHPPSSAPTEAL